MNYDDGAFATVVAMSQLPIVLADDHVFAKESDLDADTPSLVPILDTDTRAFAVGTAITGRPAQIWTGPIKASSSYLGWVTANRWLGHGCISRQLARGTGAWLLGPGGFEAIHDKATLGAIHGRETRSRCTERQGQFLAFIYAYTLANSRPPAEAPMPTCNGSFRSADLL